MCSASRSNSTSKELELLPGRLRWAPLSSPPQDGAKHYFSALSLCEDKASGTTSEYRVHHYPPQATGRAFGPLGLIQTMRFCLTLEEKIEEAQHDTSVVTLTTPPFDKATLNNALVLVGGYLLFREHWDLPQLVAAFGQEISNRLFPCSWAQRESTTGKGLRIVDCWAGLHLAREKHWIRAELLGDHHQVDLLCTEARQMVASYDSAWLIPGRIMVSADPVTTMLDPNPETFSALTPSGDDPSSLCSNISKSSTSTTESVSSDNSSPSPRPPQQAAHRCVSGTTVSTEDPDLIIKTPPTKSVPATDPLSPSANRFSGTEHEKRHVKTASVSKQYNMGLTGKFISGGSAPKDFLSYMKDHDVTIMVRTNFVREHGMQRPSYDRDVMEAGGVKHFDVPWEDVRGACPRRADVAKFLDNTDSFDIAKDDPEAILIHCKSGFGRSVCLAALLAIERFDAPGRALLGWSRIARPGAINTPQQEEFLCSMNGRDDVWRYAGRPVRRRSFGNITGLSHLRGRAPSGASSGSKDSTGSEQRSTLSSPNKLGRVSASFRKAATSSKSRISNNSNDSCSVM